MLKLILVGNQVVVAQSGNIRETTVVFVELGRGGEGNAGLEVSGDGAGLVGGGGDVVGETTSGGDEGLGDGAHFLQFKV